MTKELPAFRGRTVPSLTLDDMAKISPLDIESYLSYVSLYERNNKERENNERAKARKLSAIRSFLNIIIKRHVSE